MEQKAKLVAILSRLAAAEYDGDPTITNIEAAVPDFRRMGWINRFGPAAEWQNILSGFSTRDLERLLKVIVIAEREYDWLGGFVAAAIWMLPTPNAPMQIPMHLQCGC
jgi:hypothetical protein